MALPWFAIVILGAGTLIAAGVWILGARLRVARGEEAIPPFRTMAIRGLVTPIALGLMAADFTRSTSTWMLWVGLVLGSWLATLVVVRAVLRVMFERRVPAAEAAPASAASNVVDLRKMQAEGASA